MLEAIWREENEMPLFTSQGRCPISEGEKIGSYPIRGIGSFEYPIDLGELPNVKGVDMILA